jgi:hypothetical protein
VDEDDGFFARRGCHVPVPTLPVDQLNGTEKRQAVVGPESRVRCYLGGHTLRPVNGRHGTARIIAESQSYERSSGTKPHSLTGSARVTARSRDGKIVEGRLRRLMEMLALLRSCLPTGR